MNIAPFIEHTYLKADAKSEHIERLCQDAETYSFYGVCVPPYFVSQAKRHLQETDCKIITVVGFPMGYAATAAKVSEISRALDEGADEIDAVVNIAAIKSGHMPFVRNDIDSMTRAVHMKGKVIKIIIEMGLLSDTEIRQVCDICKEIEVDFVKTTTGMLSNRATDVIMVKTLRELLPEKISIKAAGGIDNTQLAKELLSAGAIRLGCSRSLTIIDQMHS